MYLANGRFPVKQANVIATRQFSSYLELPKDRSFNFMLTAVRTVINFSRLAIILTWWSPIKGVRLSP